MKDPTVPAFISGFATLTFVIAVMAAIVGAVAYSTRQQWNEDDPYQEED